MKEQDLEKKQKLVGPVIEYMLSYLLGGFVHPEIISGFTIDGVRGLDLETALKIRFLLNKETEEFLKELKKYLRRIRTEVSRETILSRGEAKGHIDWRGTIQKWASSSFVDKTLFNVNVSIKNYDIPENLVLKKAISILDDFMSDRKVGKEIDQNYRWSKSLRDSRKHVKNALSNVYFKRITDVNKIVITSRMKNQVNRSRKKLYRESSKVFGKYEKVFQKNDMGWLLEETFIDPDNLEKTFELFCLFSIINILDKKLKWDLKNIFEITSERKETAILAKGDYQLRIYYNVTGKLEFYDRCEPKIVKKALKQVTKAYFGVSSLDTTRRPDIILELKLNEDVLDYLLFEVKYTVDKDYVIQGINQILHYLYDMKIKGQTPFFNDGLGNGYNAAVLAYKIQSIVENRELINDNNLKVKLFQYSDILDESEVMENFLKSFIKQNCALEYFI